MIVDVGPSNSACLSSVEPLLLQAAELLRLGRLDQAKVAFSDCLRLRPNLPAALEGLANTYLRLGNSRAAGHFFQAALRQDPNRPTALNNYGNLLARDGKNGEAAALYQKAIALDADYVDCHFNLANLYGRTGCFEQAIPHYRKVVALKPSLSEAWDNLGNVLNDNGEPEEALFCLDRVLELKPGWVQAEWNRSLAFLKLGRMAEGWQAYEARLQIAALTPPRAFDAPHWDGRPFLGQTLLITTEQGLGDAIQFIRYAPHVKALGGAVVVECQPSLERLFQTAAGIDQVVARGQALPHYHWHVSVMSLPATLASSVGEIPGRTPYLWPDRRSDLACKETGPRIGLAWAGNPIHRHDRLRSCRFADLASLLEVEGIHWVSLQKNVPQQDAVDLSCCPRLTHLPGNDLYEAAQIVQQLDLVISVDTALAHLAGALNVPVWILLAKNSDWRWLLDADRSVWYSSARLFRQSQPRDWAEVIVRVCEELKRVTSGE